MADYRCRLATPGGEIVERDFSSGDANALRRQLEGQDYLVLSIQRRSAALGALGEIFSRKAKIKMSEFLFFNQEFAALIRAGLPIIEALGLLIERRENPALREAITDVRNRVKAGESLSDAFAVQEGIPALYASTLASGERSGEIATVLQRFIDYSQTISSVRRKVVGAVTYPAILVTLAMILVIVFLVFVLPGFEDFFSDLGAELPVVTQVIVGISDVLRNHWLAVTLSSVGVIFGFAIWKRTPAGARMVERMVYSLPLVGGIARRFVVTRFSRTLGTLVQGGIPLVTSMEIVARAVETPVYKDSIDVVAGKIREGAALWSSLEETGLFPGMMIEMVKVGESSGAVAEMLDHVANFTDEEIEHRLQRFVSIVEPLLLIIMALVVAMMLLAIYYPMLVAYANTQF